MKRILPSILFILMPAVALLAAPIETNKQQNTLPAIAFSSTSMYITSAQSSPFASSTADSFEGTTTLPAPQVHSYDEWEDEWEDEYAATPASPRRAPGSHSGGTSVETPGVVVGDGVGCFLVLALVFVIFQCRKTILNKLTRLYRTIQRNVIPRAKSVIQTV